MYSILSLIDNSPASEIQRIMEAVRPVLKNKNPVIWAYPHITWHTAEEYSPELVEGELTDLCTSCSPFHIKVTGIGLFTGKTQVLFLPVIKTAQLVSIQQEIYKNTQKISKKHSEYFQPDKWIPHITLISDPDEQDSIPKAIRILAEMTVDFEAKIDNICLGEYTGDSAKIIHKFEF